MVTGCSDFCLLVVPQWPDRKATRDRRAIGVSCHGQYMQRQSRNRAARIGRQCVILARPPSVRNQIGFPVLSFK